MVNLAPRFTLAMLDKYFNVLKNLFYSVHGDDVKTVMIDGKIVIANRKLKTVDEKKIVEQTRKVAESLLPRISI